MLTALTALTALLTRLQPVRIAATPEERAGIYRLRYRIYVDEQRDTHIDHVDHSRGMLCSEIDEAPGTCLLYTSPSPRDDR